MLNLYKLNTRYNGVNTDGSPKEQTWGTNFILNMTVKETMEYSFSDIEKIKTFQVKQIYFFKNEQYLSCYSNLYGVSKFTTPIGCNEIRMCLFGKYESFEVAGIGLLGDSSVSDDNFIPVVPEEPSVSTGDELELESTDTAYTELIAENTSLKAEIEKLKSDLKAYEKLEIDLSNLRKDFEVLKSM